jgi:hypothetical protein
VTAFDEPPPEPAPPPTAKPIFYSPCC